MMDDFESIRSDDPGIDAMLRDAAAAESEGDRDLAIALYQRATDMGCSDAAVHLAMMLIDGTDDERRTALRLLEKADAAGNSSGTRNLGYCYAVGIGVEKDKEKAAQLYIRAAEAGNAKAMCNIGVLYEYGHGIPQSYRDAAEWFRRSAENGYSRGMTNYACLLRDGNEVDRDPAAAAEWFRRSGSPRAKRLLALMMLKGDGIPQDTECARLLLEEASASDSKAMVLLGDMVVDTDRERAIGLYKRAMEKWNRDAPSRLRGLGIPVPEPGPRKRKR